MVTLPHKKTEGYEDHVVNTIALNYALNNSNKFFEQSKFIEYLMESWGYLYVMPTALYLNQFPFFYKKKDFLNRKNPCKPKNRALLSMVSSIDVDYNSVFVISNAFNF